MRILNRMAVTITGLEPYLEWMRQRDANFSHGLVSVPRTRAYGASYLLPEFEMEEDVLEWVEENYGWLFEFQLSAWTEDEATWPSGRDLPTFKRWFKVEIQNVVVDMGDDDIVATEL